MIVGVLTVELALLEASSLKDKRQVIKSLKQRLSNTFNVSVAETDHNDSARRCQLGISVVSNAAREVHSQLDRVVDMIRRTAGCTLVDYQREIL